MTLGVSLAALNEEQLKKVRELEQEVGTYLLAYTKPIVPAQLTDEQLAKLEALEADLGLCLVAYRKDKGHGT